MKTKKSKPAPSFETYLNELNQLIEKMETGNLDLTATLQDFERGVSLIRICQTMLNDAEQQVTLVTKEM